MNNCPIVELDEVCIKMTVGFVGSMVDEYVDDGVLFLRSQNILPFNLNLEPNQVKYISNDFDKKISKSKLYPGDIAIVRTGYPGTACVIPKDFKDLNCSDLVIVRPDNSKINSDYLCNYINSPIGKGAIFGSLVGVAQQHFNVGVAKKMKIKLPPLPIQKKIASILSVYDELIENNKQRIKLLEEMAEEIYKEWFVRLRFPDYENTKIVDGLPEGWVNGTIGDLYTVKSGFAFKSEMFGDIGSPIIKIKNIDNWEVNTFNCDRYSGEINERIKKFELLNGDLLIAMTGATIGKVALFRSQKEAYFLNQRTGKFFSKNNNIQNQSFIYQFTKSKIFQESVNNFALGAAQPNISGEQIENLKFLIPSNEIFLHFNQLVGNMIEEIFILKDKNQLLQETRDLLLPRLISGKLSVEHLIEKEEELMMVAEPRAEYKKA